MPITINWDSIFLIVDDAGDVKPGADLGLYFQSTRFLSRYELRLGGAVPESLTSRNVTYYRAVHVLTNPALDGMNEGSVSIVRSQTVGDGLHEDISITNFSDSTVKLPLEIHFGADFIDILQLRGRMVTGGSLGQRNQGSYWATVSPDGLSLSLNYSGARYNPTTSMRFSRPLQISPSGDKAFVEASIDHHGTWHLCVDVSTFARAAKPAVVHGHQKAQRTGEASQLNEQEQNLLAVAPRLNTDNDILQRAYERSIKDFASLRLTGPDIPQEDFVVAAGIPWFTALFGRDSLIASYQALPYLPQVPQGTLRALAKFQGTKVDPENEEQPGKILHEYRRGQIAERGLWIRKWPYYGSIDATPLFVIVFSEVYRYLGDLGFVRELLGNAERALEWMDHYGDVDGDGYIEYINRSGIGLENQGWKDSGNAIQFQDGHLARPPIALCEVQGYAYLAKTRMAEVYERLGQHDRATQLRSQASSLRERFNKDFWLPHRNCYAVALDGDKRPVDGLASNQGQALWTGIIEKARIQAVVDSLTSPDMFSGWGIRTLGKSEGGYSPLGYHIGSVWPHDNAIIGSAFAGHGYKQHLGMVFRGLLEVMEARPEARLSELFSGYGKDEFPFPVRYPIASGIQAWASGTPLLLLTSLLGLSVDAARRKIYLDPYLPQGTNRIEIDGLHVGGGELKVSIERTYGETQTRLRSVPKGFKVEGTISRWSIFW